MTLKSCLLQAPILGFPTEDDRFLLDTDASLFAVGGVLNQLHVEIGRLLSHTPDIVSGCPSGGIVLLAGKCWWLSQCALTFALIYEARSLRCAPIIIHSGGCRSFVTVIIC